VRKGGGGGGLHYSLDIMSYFKDLTQKLANLLSQIRTKTCPDTFSNVFLQIAKKDISITNTLSNREKRDVHYKLQDRSRTQNSWDDPLHNTEGREIVKLMR
jgi:hypothetical protein